MSVTNSGFNVNLLFLLSYVHERRKTVNKIFDIPFENKVSFFDFNQYNRVHKKCDICITQQYEPGTDAAIITTYH